MNRSKTLLKDPICGMTVEKGTAIQAERDGKTFYFCSEHCRNYFIAKSTAAKAAAAKSQDKSENWYFG